jgi:hypothetical protein
MTMTLRETCQSVGPTLPAIAHNGVPCDGALVLWAFAGIESTFGRDREVPRFEASYAPGGYMYRTSPLVRALWAQYGRPGASSWGTWQMMLPTARDLGFAGEPHELTHDAVLAPLFARYLVRSQALTLVDCADAYNSGNYRDRIIPVDYMAGIVTAYERGWAGGPA